MDPVTHAVLGAAVGQAGFRRRLGRRALVLGALVALLPDADIVAKYVGGPYASLLYHRGVTHSVFFAALVGPLLGWLVWKRTRDDLAAWIGLMTAALLTHPLIDVVTHYGTQLLAPLVTTRFAIPAMGIIDPVFTLILLLAVIIGATTRRLALSSAAAWAGLIAAYGYALFAWSLNLGAEDEARRQLAAQGITAEVHAYPTVFQPYLRRIVARSGDEVLVGFHSALAPKPIAWTRAHASNGPAVEAVRASDQGRILAWFASGQVLWRIEDGAVLGTDLRYGYPGGSELGQWGIRAPLDATSPPEMFSIAPRLRMDNIELLWGWVFG